MIILNLLTNKKGKMKIEVAHCFFSIFNTFSIDGCCNYSDHNCDGKTNVRSQQLTVDYSILI